jgi:mediator of RNA polymerase II transcription subunit 13
MCVSVILAPFGLAGTVTGQAYKTMDVQTKRQLDEWRQFYPIDTKFSSCEAGGEEVLLPLAVEVVVGGVKMRYPTCYVLVTDMDDPASSPSSAVRQDAASPIGTAVNVMKPVGLPTSSAAVVTPPCSPCPQSISVRNRPLCPSSPFPATVSGHHPASMQHSPSPATRLPEHVWQDSTLNPVQHEGTEQNGVGNDTTANQLSQAGQWDFVDPTRKSTCSCSK